LAANAATITAAASARRNNAVTGNKTCVTPQPVHRDRRGHSCTGPDDAVVTHPKEARRWQAARVFDERNHEWRE
jgi:hypothetical protein